MLGTLFLTCENNDFTSCREVGFSHSLVTRLNFWAGAAAAVMKHWLNDLKSSSPTLGSRQIDAKSSVSPIESPMDSPSPSMRFIEALKTKVNDKLGLNEWKGQVVVCCCWRQDSGNSMNWLDQPRTGQRTKQTGHYDSCVETKRTSNRMDLPDIVIVTRGKWNKTRRNRKKNESQSLAKVLEAPTRRLRMRTLIRRLHFRMAVQRIVTLAGACFCFDLNCCCQKSKAQIIFLCLNRK